MDKTKFGKLTVIRKERTDHSGRPIYRCECDCGNLTFTPLASLKQGLITSCEECSPTRERRPLTRRKTKINIESGQRFAKLTVISFAGYVNNRRNWHCVCDCGSTKKADQYNLIYGFTKSCGCVQRGVKGLGQRQKNG